MKKFKKTAIILLTVFTTYAMASNMKDIKDMEIQIQKTGTSTYFKADNAINIWQTNTYALNDSGVQAAALPDKTMPATTENSPVNYQAAENRPVNYQENKFTYISKERYNASRVFSAVLGFGTGHILQQRYLAGTLFAVSEVTALFAGGSGWGDLTTLSVLGLYAFIGLRIWESISAGSLPASYKIQPPAEKSSYLPAPIFYAGNYSVPHITVPVFGFHW